MRNDLVKHAACHSGDMLFELCYPQDFSRFVTELHQHGGSPA